MTVTLSPIQDFIKTISPIAQREYKKGKKILPSVCIAQCCMESAYGTTTKMKNANAMLGIKVGKSRYHFGTAWHDKAYNTKTHECYDGKTYTEITDFFRAYDSISDCIEDYYDMLCHCNRYRKAVGLSDYKEEIKAIQNGGYATGLDYCNTAIKIMEKNNLTKYDKITEENPVIHTGGNKLNKIELATAYAESIANDDSHGYDQIHRWGQDYDCSALVIESFEQAGVPVKTNGATYTGNMKKVFLKSGFSDITSLINLPTGEGLVRGDVLLREGHHTAIYVGNGKIVHASINENGTTKGGDTGDQTGKEICIRSYYNKPWNCVLRFIDKSESNAKVSQEIIAKEVIAGKWGKGTERMEKLSKAGYDYTEIQSKVNELMKSSKHNIVLHKVVLGDTLSHLASKYDVNVDKIIEQNKEKYPRISPNFIVRGWVLKI